MWAHRDAYEEHFEKEIIVNQENVNKKCNPYKNRYLIFHWILIVILYVLLFTIFLKKCDEI